MSFARWGDVYLAIVEWYGDDGAVTDQTWASSTGLSWNLLASMTGPDMSPMLMADGPAGTLAARVAVDKMEVFAPRG